MKELPESRFYPVWQNMNDICEAWAIIHDVEMIPYFAGYHEWMMVKAIALSLRLEMDGPNSFHQMLRDAKYDQDADVLKDKWEPLKNFANRVLAHRGDGNGVRQIDPPTWGQLRDMSVTMCALVEKHLERDIPEWWAINHDPQFRLDVVSLPSTGPKRFVTSCGDRSLFS